MNRSLKLGPAITILPRMTIATNAAAQGVVQMHVSRLRPVKQDHPARADFRAALFFCEANGINVVGNFPQMTSIDMEDEWME